MPLRGDVKNSCSRLGLDHAGGDVGETCDIEFVNRFAQPMPVPDGIARGGPRPAPKMSKVQLRALRGLWLLVAARAWLRPDSLPANTSNHPSPAECSPHPSQYLLASGRQTTEACVHDLQTMGHFALRLWPQLIASLWERGMPLVVSGVYALYRAIIYAQPGQTKHADH